MESREFNRKFGSYEFVGSLEFDYKFWRYEFGIGFSFIKMYFFNFNLVILLWFLNFNFRVGEILIINIGSFLYFKL